MIYIIKDFVVYLFSLKKYKDKTKQVIVIRRDLNMSVEKTVTQVINATLFNPTVKRYSYPTNHVTLCCYVDSNHEFMQLQGRAIEAKINTGSQYDGWEYTVLSLGPVEGRDEIAKLDKLIKGLQIAKGYDDVTSNADNF